MTKIGELGTTLAVTSNRRATRRNIPEDAILHSHRRENIKSYVFTRVRFVFIVTILTEVTLQIKRLLSL
jgi:hypothetical protein